jgi:hypothetical protein
MIALVKPGDMPYLWLRISYGITLSVFGRTLLICAFTEPVSDERVRITIRKLSVNRFAHWCVLFGGNSFHLLS